VVDRFPESPGRCSRAGMDIVSCYASAAVLRVCTAMPKAFAATDLRHPTCLQQHLMLGRHVEELHHLSQQKPMSCSGKCTECMWQTLLSAP
jgi:hypothetical protein